MLRATASGHTILLYASSESDADVWYATRFFCPDPFVFIRTATGRRIFAMSDLEIDRTRAQAKAHRVLSFSRYAERAGARLGSEPTPADVVAEVLRDLSIRAVLVPARFPAGMVEQLRARGVRVVYGDISQRDMLHHAGIHHAEIIVCSLPDMVLNSGSRSSM